MVLNVYFRKEWLHASTNSEISDLISRVISSMDYEARIEGRYFPGEDAWVQFSEEPLREMEDLFREGVQLRIAVNVNTGYGAITWGDDADEDVLWVTDNPAPPKFNPRVVLDPCIPTFHDLSSAIPVVDFRKALEEFCLSKTKGRPVCVKWVRADLNGRRLDR